MELSDQYLAQNGRRVQIYEGLIMRDELRVDDEIHMQIGKLLLLGRVIEEEKPTIALHLVSHEPISLGNHPITAKAMDGRWPRPPKETPDKPLPIIEEKPQENGNGHYHRKPVSFDDSFMVRMRRQGVNIDNVPHEELARSRVRKGYPIVLRRS